MTQIPRGIPWARSVKPYAEYVDTLNDFGKKGGEYGLKVGAWGGPVLGLNFVGGIRQGAFPAQGLREKVGELRKCRLTSRLACLMESPFGKVFGGNFWVPGKSAAKKLDTSSSTLIFLRKIQSGQTKKKNNKKR